MVTQDTMQLKTQRNSPTVKGMVGMHTALGSTLNKYTDNQPSILHNHLLHL